MNAEQVLALMALLADLRMQVGAQAEEIARLNAILAQSSAAGPGDE